MQSLTCYEEMQYRLMRAILHFFKSLSLFNRSFTCSARVLRAEKYGEIRNGNSIWGKNIFKALFADDGYMDLCKKGTHCHTGDDNSI